ncbi:MAG: PKD domain-containing protein [Saprospiraceae bacterium]
MNIFLKIISSEIGQLRQCLCAPMKSFPSKALFKLDSLLLPILFLFVSSNLLSQTPLSGVINHYAEITDIDFCESKLVTDDASAFTIGEQVLLIQMKGAIINESNSAAFGDVLEIGGAGLLEKNEIVAIVGNEVFLKYLLSNDYEVAGAVQLVSFPKYSQAVVSEIISPAKWDGKKGGVLVIEVEEDLILQATIEADGKGFRGASTNTLSSDCTFLTNADGYHYSLSNWRGAPKGEGIADLIQGKEQGRGAQANGGGGGNDHNAGGGGGANITNAGEGGKTSSPGLNCDGDFPGKGGKPIQNAPNRWFLGGGGGAGHDNNGSGSAGGNGGGLVIILAKRIISNGNAISANGESAAMAIGDGSGGGGAGGTVVLVAEEIMGQLSISAVGGQGGFVQNPADRCNGPGGGGSGGRFISNNFNSVNLNLSGGLPGENMTVSSQCSDPTNGAAQGQAGLQTPYEEIPISEVEPIPFAILSQPIDKLVCENDAAFFEFLVMGNFLKYQWQVNDGSGWQDIPSGIGYAGEMTPILEIPNSILSQNAFSYRCLVTGPCISNMLSAAAVLTVEAVPQAAFDFNYLGNGQYTFENNSINAIAYLWDFGDGTTTSEINPDHTFAADGQYEVTLTAFNDCGEIMITQSVTVGGFPTAAFSAAYFGCTPVDVQFQDQSSGENIQSYFWEFEGGDPSISNQQHPLVTYAEPGIYDVTLTVQNALGEHTTTKNDYLEIFATPQVSFDFLVDSVTVYFSNNSTGATYYFWDFGDGNSSDEFEPVHIYSQGGAYQVSLSIGNPACGSVISQQVFIDLPNAAEETILPAFTIFPNPFSEGITVLFAENPNEQTVITLFDGQGQFLHSGTVMGKMGKLKPTGLAAGLYFLQIQNSSTTRYVKLLKLNAD